MTADGWMTLGVVTLTVIALARDFVAPAIAVLAATILLMFVGVIDAAQAFAGFSNPAPITVAALYVVARAVEKTGALQPLVAATLGDRGNGRSSLARLLVPTAGASAFLNNTPIVAMLAPQVADWSDRRGLPASWYLMPLSFAAILGGTMTAIGTSTNLVVSGLLEASGQAPIGMFEMTRVGLPVALAGLFLIVLLAPVVLPDRRTARQQLQQDIREFTVDMFVEPGGALAGKSVAGGGLRHLKGLYLVELDRRGQSVAPVAPTMVLEDGDRLTFAGRADTVVELQAMRGLRSAEQQHASGYSNGKHTFFEAVVSEASPLVGKTLKEADFRSRYQAAVVAIHRSGSRVKAKLGEVRLKAGDTLLLLSDVGFRKRWYDRSDFLLVSRLGGSPPVTTHQAWIVGLITLGIVLVAGAGLVPILHASLMGALALLLFGVLTPSEARNAVDLDVVIVIAASFGLGAAVAVSGLAQVVATGIISAFSGLGPVGVLVAVTLAVALFTEVVTNNAAAVLMFPIAMATATSMGLEPRGFAIAVAVAASASFLTPIGYQTNTMVYGPGGYRFGDYVRLGLPLNLIVVLAIALAVPLFWPLQG
jgi:di/tricarboxylate transporter